MQITKEFEMKGYVIALYDKSRLSAALEKIKTFKPKSMNQTVKTLR